MLMRTPPLKVIWNLVFIWLLDLSSAENPYCPICGPGMIVTEPDGEVFIPAYGTFTCEKLEIRSKEGYVPAKNCFALQIFARGDCGCESPPPTDPPSAPPTEPPTSAPSAATTEVPKTNWASGLQLTLYGIPSLPGRSIQAFVKEAETHIAGYYSESQNGDKISQRALYVKTSIWVTGFQVVTSNRQNLRGLEEELDLQNKYTPPYVTITFKQFFSWQQASKGQNIDVKYLAQKPFASITERSNFMEALKTAKPNPFGDLTGISEVTFLAQGILQWGERK